MCLHTYHNLPRYLPPYEVVFHQSTSYFCGEAWLACWELPRLGCPACPASFIICFQVCNAFGVKIQQPWLLSSLFTSSQLFLGLQPRIVAHQFPPHIPQPRKMSSCYSTASLIHDSHVVQVANITARYPIATLQSMGKEQCRLRHDHSGAL